MNLTASHAHALASRHLTGRALAHSLRVGDALPEGTLRQAGYLHDLVEDGHVTLEAIRLAFGDQVADTVDAVTRRPEETYAEFVARAASHELGRQVKLADVRDNLSDLPETHSLHRRYTRAIETLTGTAGA
jgi:(p)ppGpp synthase/HD superfamily hydrolase